MALARLAWHPAIFFVMTSNLLCCVDRDGFPFNQSGVDTEPFPVGGKKNLGVWGCSYTGTLSVPQCMNLFQDFKFLPGGNRVFSGGVFINWDLKYTFSKILKF